MLKIQYRNTVPTEQKQKYSTESESKSGIRKILEVIDGINRAINVNRAEDVTMRAYQCRSDCAQYKPYNVFKSVLNPDHYKS